MRAILIGAVMLLAACAGSAETRTVNALAIACDTYATALDQLTSLRASGNLSPAMVGRVNATNELIDPACSSGSSVEPVEAVATVREGIALLKTIKEALQ